jgi:hypothetical protein
MAALGRHQPHGSNRQPSSPELALPGTTDHTASQSDCLNFRIGETTPVRDHTRISVCLDSVRGPFLPL